MFLVVKRLCTAFAFVLASGAPLSALAQGTMLPEPAPAESATPAQADTAATAQPEASATPAPTTATTPAPAPVPTVVVAPPTPVVPAEGQWVYTDTYGWIWVPRGATSVIVQEQPYVYLYTPVYGWTWYGSPWGPGAYYVGPWVHHGYAPARVWHRSSWYAPHVVARPRVVATPHRGSGSHRGHR